MGAIFAVVLHYLQRVLGLQWPPDSSLAVCSLLLATIAFAFHIFGDLVPAFWQQKIMRKTVEFTVK
jgi:CBS domain containing-hemolysin-like protein